MLITLPNEVERLIFDFLIMPQDINKVCRISKYMRELVRNIDFIKQKRELDNKCYMLMEDKDSYHYLERDLGNDWEYFHKWAWPPNIVEKTFDRTPLWKAGMYVDALDKIEVWGSALIVEVEYKIKHHIFSTTRIKKYLVRFLGWSKSFDEWIEASKIARFGQKCMNPRNKYDSLEHDHSRWVLFKSDDEWNIESLQVKETTNDSKICLINQKPVIIARHNIDDVLRTISNGSAFLSQKIRRGFNPVLRFLKY